MAAYQRRGGSSDRSRAIAIGVALLLIVGAAGAWFLLRSDDAGQEPTAGETQRDTAGAPADVTRPAEDLPELDASDELVRRLAEELSSRPRLAEWLATEDLIRRFVGAVVRIAVGRSPRDPLEFLESDVDPGDGFDVRDGPDRPTVIHPEAYDRYDPVAVTFASLDARGTAELYRRLRPLFQDAYRELGFTDGSFDRALARAVDVLLAVPVPEAPIEVVPAGGTAWEYRDPELEELDPAQKHLLRMGPENVRRIQSKLRELAGALDLPEVRSGASPTG